MSGVLLRGGGTTYEDGNVKVNVPTANMRTQAIVANPQSHALLVPKERDPKEARFCVRCKSPDIVVEVHFTSDDNDAVRLCRNCVEARVPGNPIVVNLSKVK